MKDPRITEGAVVQITSMEAGREGWLGAFVTVTELKSFGIQGYVHHIETHQESGRAFTRLNWAQIEYIGQAILVIDRGPVE